MGTLVLVGWAFDIPTLKSVLPHLVSMKANTALCFLLAGISLWLLQLPEPESGRQLRHWLAHAAAAAGVAVSALTLGEELFGWNLGIDQLLFREAPGAIQTTFPGRMSPHSALISALYCASLLLLDARSRRVRLSGSFLTLAGTMISYVGVLAYIYSAEDIYQIGSLNGMALHSALAFLVLGLGILAARPEREPLAVVTAGYPGSVVARLVLAVLLAPAVLGWFSWRGQEQGRFGSDVATALLVAAVSLVLLGLVYWAAHSLNHLEEKRKRAEEALRLQAAALEAAQNEIVITDRDGAIEWVNPAMVSATGYSTAELIGQNPRRLKSGKHDQAFYQHLWDTILAGQVWEGVITNRRKDGSLYDTNKVITPVRSDDGEVHHFIAIGQDITEQRRSEEARRRSEEAMRSLVENAPYAIYRTQVDKGRFVSVNPALVQMLGYATAEEVLALDIARDVYRSAEDRAKVVQTLEAEREFRDLELHWKRKDGKLLLLRTSGRIVRDDAGQEYFEAIAEDVTERRLLEAQFRQAQKMEAIGQLAGGVAHDFNNLLMIISSYAELMSEAGPVNESQAHHVEEVRKACRRAAALTGQLLAFSRKQLLAPTVLDLNAVVRDIGKMVPRLIGEHITVRLLAKAPNACVEADRGQLEQILMNLAVNARDAMPQGGSLILEVTEAEFDAPHVGPGYNIPPGDYVMLAVSDTGQGMDAETQTHIFEPFFTTKERGRGTGLGLATVYGIVKQSNGYISVYSEKGVGTTFKMYFPRVERKAATDFARVEGPAPGGPETLLLVEDEEPVRLAAREFLQSRGYTVLDAGNAAEALRLHAQHSGRIHLLITDVVMPGGSGHELAGKLRNLDPSLRVLYISGYTGGTVNTMAGLEPGASFLQKPFALESLARSVRSVLDTAPQESSAQ